MSEQTNAEMVNLLVGFDAMRSFLRGRWEADGKQSDELASLLGNLNRDVWRNGQPADIAQWGDWLEAVSSVRPDLNDVSDARRQMQEEHNQLRQILASNSTEQQKKLDEFRKEAALHTWHRIGFFPLRVIDAYESMRAFLQAYWKRGGGGDSDLGELVDRLRDENALRRDWIHSLEQAKSEVARSPLIS